MAPIFTLEENDWSDTETPFVGVKQQERSTSLVQVKPEPPQIKEEHQERSPSLVQVKPEPPQIKEEHQERSTSLVQVKPEPPQIKEEPEEELLQRPEEAAGSSLTLLSVKSEDDDGNRETEPLASTSTEHMKTQADVEHCGTSQPAGEDQLLSSHRSDSDAEDSDEWDPSVLDRLKRGKKSFASTMCGQVSGSMGDLKKHMRTHTGEFVCSVCNKRFNQKQDVINHMRFHKEQRSFACSVCNKSLINGQSLRQHMQLHTGEKPFACSVCRENFQYKYQLIKHMDTHTGGKPCDSSVRSKRFTQSLNLETHTTGSSLTLPAVISEDDDGNRETEPLASTSTEHMKTQADVEHCGTSQPAVEVELLSSHGSESDAEDSDEWVPSEDSDEGVPSEDSDEGVPSENSDEWVPPVSKRLKSQKTQRVKGQRLSRNTKSSKRTQSLSVVPRQASIGVSNLSGSPYTRPGSSLTLPAVISEDDDGNIETEPLASTSTEHMKTKAEVEHCGTSQPAVEDQLLSSHGSESDAEDSDEGVPSDDSDEWVPSEDRDEGVPSEDSDEWVPSVSNRLKSQKTQRVKGQRLSQNTKSPKQTLSLSVVPRQALIGVSNLSGSPYTRPARKIFQPTHASFAGRPHTLLKLTRSETGEKSFSCTVCGKVSDSKGNLINHMKTHTGEKTFSCSVCDKSFGYKCVLINHMRTHTGEKPFACSVCDKSFNVAHHLNSHMRTHTGDKPFACSVCNKRFGQSVNLKSHMTTHVDEMPFACSVCHDSFKRFGSLVKHMMIHTGEKKFACSLCNRRFRQSREMKTHMRTHTGERPFVCSVCNKSFIRSDLLVKHKRSHTGVMALSSSVQSEDDDGNREREPLASTSTEHMKTRSGMRLKNKI